MLINEGQGKLDEMIVTAACCALMTDAEMNGKGCFLCSELRPWGEPISEGTLAMPSVSYPFNSCETE